MTRDYPMFDVWFGRDAYFLDGYVLNLIILPWPKGEQEIGGKLRALVNLEIRFTRRGISWDRYSPNRAEYWLRANQPGVLA